MNVTPIPAETDLEVTTLTDSPDPVSLSAANHDITYSASVVNKGRSTATQVKVTDVLPAGMTFVSASSAQGSCSFGSSTITCSLGTLIKNSPRTITIILRPTTTGAKTNTVSISSTSISNGTEQDPVSGNNSKTVTTQVNP
jgi:uncharacterized repeat protein (TIGR01451 family)